MNPQPRFLHAKVVRLHQRKGARTHSEPCSRTRRAGVSIGVSGSFSDSCWETLDRVNLQVLESRFPVLQNCPHSVRGRFRQAVRTALEGRSEAVRSQDALGEVRGWKLFCGAVQTATECPSWSCVGGWTCSAEALGKT